MRVRAVKLGFYGGLREPGVEFEIASSKDLGSWMEALEAPPEDPPPATRPARRRRKPAPQS